MNEKRFDLDDTLDSSVREQRWFAAVSATKALQAECDVLRQVRDLADAEWQVARARLESFETLCDALSEDFLEYSADPSTGSAVFTEVMSAA